jgi:hypothetical protein
MLISRISRKPSDNSPYKSRFRGAGGGAFALRQYLRCREEFYQRIVMTIVQTCFVIFLLMFARTLHRLFVAHGQDLSIGVEIVCQALLLVFIIFMARRAVRNALDIKMLRHETKRLYEESRRTE